VPWKCKAIKGSTTEPKKSNAPWFHLLLKIENPATTKAAIPNSLATISQSAYVISEPFSFSDVLLMLKYRQIVEMNRQAQPRYMIISMGLVLLKRLIFIFNLSVLS